MDSGTSIDQQIALQEEVLKTEIIVNESEFENKETVNKIVKKYQNRVNQMLKLIHKQKKQNQTLREQFRVLNEQLNTVLKRINNSKVKSEDEITQDLIHKHESLKKEMENEMKKNQILKKENDQIKQKQKYLEGDKIDDLRNQIKEKQIIILDQKETIKLYQKIEKHDKNTDAHKKQLDLLEKIVKQNQQILHLKKKVNQLKKIEENLEKNIKSKNQQLLAFEQKLNQNKVAPISLAKSKEKDEKAIDKDEYEKLAQRYRAIELSKKQNDKHFNKEIDNLQLKIKIQEKQLCDVSDQVVRKQKELNIVMSRLKQRERKNANTLEPIGRVSQLRQSEQIMHSSLFEHRKQYRGLTHSSGNERYFDDSELLPLEKNYRMKKLMFSNFEEHILSMTTEYSMQNEEKGGETSFLIESFKIASSYANIKSSEFLLTDYEYIHSIELYSAKHIEFIRFKTSRENIFEVGNPKNTSKCKIHRFEIRHNQKPISFMGIIETKRVHGSQEPKQFLISLGIEIRKKQVFMRTKYNKRAQSHYKHSSMTIPIDKRSNDKNIPEEEA